MDHDDVVQVELQRAACGPDGVARVVHEGLRLEQRDGGAAGMDPPDRETPLVLVLRARHVPALGEQLDHGEADVVARGGIAAARVAEAHYEPVGVVASEETQRYSPEASASAAASPACSASSPVAPSAPASPSASSPTTSASSSSFDSSATTEGMTIVAMIVSSRLSRNSTPSGGVSADRCIVSCMPRAE